MCTIYICIQLLYYMLMRIIIIASNKQKTRLPSAVYNIEK